MTNIVLLHDAETVTNYVWNWDSEEFQTMNGEFQQLPDYLERFQHYKNHDIICYLESKRGTYNPDSKYLFVENIDCYTVDAE